MTNNSSTSTDTGTETKRSLAEVVDSLIDPSTGQPRTRKLTLPTGEKIRLNGNPPAKIDIAEGVPPVNVLASVVAGGVDSDHHAAFLVAATVEDDRELMAAALVDPYRNTLWMARTVGIVITWYRTLFQAYDLRLDPTEDDDAAEGGRVPLGGASPA